MTGGNSRLRSSEQGTRLISHFMRAQGVSVHEKLDYSLPLSSAASEIPERLVAAPAKWSVIAIPLDPSQPALMLESGSQAQVTAVSSPAPFPKESDRAAEV